MKVVMLPRTTVGIIDLRKQDYIILEKITYIEDIIREMMVKNKNISDYKMCPFEDSSLIPFYFKVVDKIGDKISAFEIERVRYNEVDIDEKEKERLIRDVLITPLNKELKDIVDIATEMIVLERLGQKIDEDKMMDLEIKRENIVRKVKEFDYKKYLEEIV